MSNDLQILEHVVAGLDISIAETLQLIQRKELRLRGVYKKGRNRLARLMGAKTKAESDLKRLNRMNNLVIQRTEMEVAVARAYRDR